MDDPDLDAFVALSAALTGFRPEELRATGLVGRHLDTVRGQAAGGPYRALVDHSGPVGNEWPIGSDTTDPNLQEFARAVTYLWYTGVWPAGPEQRASIAAPEAYAQALVWKTFQGHPPGTSAPGFGSWSRPPARPGTGVSGRPA
jgi:hypothetical protein